MPRGHVLSFLLQVSACLGALRCSDGQCCYICSQWQPLPKMVEDQFPWLGGSSFSSSQSSCRVKGTFTIRLEVQAWPMWHVLRDFHGFPLAHGTCQEVSMLGTITRSLVGWFSDESGQSIQ